MSEEISKKNETATNNEKAAANPRIHIFPSREEAILANAYLVETASGVVAIDGTLTVSTSRALRDKFTNIGKPLYAVLVTHGHPDHYNGIATLISGSQVPVIATGGVNAVIRQYDEAKVKQWTPLFGTEWPENRIFPNKILQSGESVSFDGVKFTVHDLGPGESHADSYWIMEASDQFAFIGDVVLNGVHAYVADGHTTLWLQNLKKLKKELAKAKLLFPGHGPAGGLEILDWQTSYLNHYRDTVGRLAGGKKELSDSQKKELEDEMRKFLPDGRLTFLIAMGANAVAAELNAGK
jgi:glyoxylase-like metal-dependent hydrolase (beta-lactamase superfamily II)